jgi:hypothetical protein
MRQALQAIGALSLSLMLGFATFCPAAAAEEAKPESTQDQSAENLPQIKLTEGQLTGYIAAQPDMMAILPKLEKAGSSPSPELEAELEGIAKKHGFSDFAELNAVATTISIVMAGFDNETGEFTEPLEALKRELAEITADSSIPAEDKKELVEELTAAIRATPPIKHRENVDLVKAHREAIEKALE